MVIKSTNDTAIILASGLAGNKLIAKEDASYIKFKNALVDLCQDLARQMAFDAEGATRIFKWLSQVRQVKKTRAKAARAVADYDLVKCAVHGGDPNWGRIICAVGSSRVKLNPDKFPASSMSYQYSKTALPSILTAKKRAKSFRRKAIR